MPDLGETLIALDRIDDLAHDARRVPLSGQVRVDPDTFRADLVIVRAGSAEVLADEARVSHRPLTGHIETLERLIAEAPTMPLGSKVRLRPKAVYDAVDEIRAELPEALLRRRRAEQDEA